MVGSGRIISADSPVDHSPNLVIMENDHLSYQELGRQSIPVKKLMSLNDVRELYKKQLHNK